VVDFSPIELSIQNFEILKFRINDTIYPLRIISRQRKDQLGRYHRHPADVTAPATNQTTAAALAEAGQLPNTDAAAAKTISGRPGSLQITRTGIEEEDEGAVGVEQT
jgi:hypothetical protein